MHHCTQCAVDEGRVDVLHVGPCQVDRFVDLLTSGTDCDEGDKSDFGVNGAASACVDEGRVHEQDIPSSEVHGYFAPGLGQTVGKEDGCVRGADETLLLPDSGGSGEQQNRWQPDR
jgi:hypothetical protein